jgi:hypothetical protein
VTVNPSRQQEILLYVFIFRPRLQRRKSRTAKLHGPMTCGYGIDAIRVPREMHLLWRWLI